MRKIILIAMIALLGFSSCKKTTINNYSGRELAPEPGFLPVYGGEVYRHTDAYILANKWVLIKRNESPINGEVGSWKFQVKGTNNFIIVSPAPDNMYWKTKYDELTVHDGDFILSLKHLIKQFN